MSAKKNILKNIAIVASDAPEAEAAAKRLAERYDTVPPDQADVIVALGGDGLMLRTLHAHMHAGTPIYGMNCGSVGFLMNEYEDDALPDRLQAAETSVLHPLRMTAVDGDGNGHDALAINEVSIFRQTYQAAKLKISVDSTVRMEELICDGVLVATPAGSTAYNLSAHGPILPITAHLLALTPISPFRPRRWRGAILSSEARVRIEVLEPAKRPVSAVADHIEFAGVVDVRVEEDKSTDLLMMFDPHHALGERSLAEQFKY
jgi:NAD+ kinase